MSINVDKINPNSILNHINKLVDDNGPKSLDELITEIKKLLPKVNFKNEAGLSDDDQVKAKHLLVIVVEKLLEVARMNGSALCKNLEFTYIFNGYHWELLEKQKLIGFIGEAAESLGVDKYQSRHYQFRIHLMKQFECLAVLPSPKKHIGKQLINLRNGTFDITVTGGELRGFDSNDFLTYCLPFEYNVDAKAPIFKRYLNRVLPEKQLQNVLSEYVGYILARNLKLSKVLILLGGGANGKSVFFDIICALLGEKNISNYSLQSLTDKKGYNRASIANKLLNYASEINGKLDTSIFKQLASDEPIEGRLPYGNPMIIKEYARFMFNCNELPRDIEFTHAFFRRFIIVPFNQTIPKEEQDPELANKIVENELSGVFNWVLNGMARIIKNKQFSSSPIIDDIVKQFQIDSDSVRSYIEDNIIVPTKHPDEGKRYLKELYDSYRSYCYNDGLKPLGKKKFKNRLLAIDFIDSKDRNGIYILMKNRE